MGYIGVITYNSLILTIDPNFLGHPFCTWKFDACKMNMSFGITHFQGRTVSSSCVYLLSMKSNIFFLKEEAQIVFQYVPWKNSLQRNGCC